MEHLLAVPLVARVIGLLMAAALFAYGWLKRKAIAAATGAVTSAVKSRFWGWAHEQMKANTPPTDAASAKPSNEKTYRGTFDWYGRPLSSRNHFFTLMLEGKTIKVPVTRTELFSELRRGDYVEIDTQTGVYIGEEIVLRVSKATEERRK